MDRNLVARLEDGEEVNVAIEACRLARVPLTIVGDGPEREALERLAAGSARFTGRLSDEEVRALYQRAAVTLLPGRYVVAADQSGDEVVLECLTSERREEHRFRRVVVATGREHVAPPFDDDLRERIDVDEDAEMVVEADFSVRWKGMNGHRIFALNHSRYSHGLTNAGLTLLPVRAALVLNSLFGRELYRITDDLCPVRW